MTEWRTVLIDTILAAGIIALGHALFARFEERTPGVVRWRKMILFVAITTLLAATLGRPWSMGWALGAPLLGLSFHFIWCWRHKIHPLSAEPKHRYYELRGWRL